jgi:hypothetical protein
LCTSYSSKFLRPPMTSLTIVLTLPKEEKVKWHQKIV